jgi:pimeloyl-ACP methyl ester carboxylesterase
MKIVFVHGACVRDGAWWWARVAALLRAEGIESTSALLPSCGETGVSSAASLAEDVEAVAELLRPDDPTIVVAHSYGGVVATAAAVEGDVRHLVYVSSFLPAVGESLSTFSGPVPPPFLEFSADGTFSAVPSMMRDRFLHDCDDETTEAAIARLTRQTASVNAEPVKAAAWSKIPSTYLVCADDRATPPELQRSQAERAGRVVELPTGHHPMLSRPDLVAAEIVAVGR